MSDFRNWRCIACFIMAFWVSAPLYAENEPTLRITSPAQVYHMGDMMPMRISIMLPHGSHIDEESLPLTGRVTPWLDLRKISYITHQQTLEVELLWQLFATVEMPQVLKTPAFSIKIKGTIPYVVNVPAHAFYYAANFAYPMTSIARQPSLPPPRFGEPIHQLLALTCLVLALGLLLVWAWLKDLLPFLPFQPGPLHRVYRQWQHQQHQHLSLEQRKVLHHALNHTAGQTLYPNSLAVLFDKAPYLEPFKPQILAFFHTSWAQLYHMHPLKKVDVAPIDFIATQQWLKQAALAERVYRKSKAIHAE